VIPLFLDQIRAGRPLTVTDPEMTRFMMSLDDAVDLVLYAFQHGRPGDLFVQKAPAATLGTLVEAMKRVFHAANPVQVIGTRHGEKLYETLLTREERARADDLESYFRVAADNRDLNYAKYFSEGEAGVSATEDYNSHNTRRLSVNEMETTLQKLPFIQAALEGRPPNQGGG
jgi:UDP-glucose 4-epimerase